MSNNNNNNAKDVFAKHTAADTALNPPNANSNEIGLNSNGGMTNIGKIVVFIIFPLSVGILGLYYSYLDSLSNPDRELSLDRDFIMPVLLALTMVIIVGFQTSGFRKKEMSPLIQWPKVRRVKKIVRRKVPKAKKEE